MSPPTPRCRPTGSAAQIAALDRADGDIDTLMQRLSGVRVWSYIAARSDWVKDTLHWQARAREVEDKLSDALHESLTSRFVDRRSAHLVRRLEEAEGQELLSAVTRRGEVVVEGHDVGHIEGFGFVPDPLAVGDEKKLVLRAARRALRAEMPRRVAVLESAADERFRADRRSPVTWDGVPVAQADARQPCRCGRGSRCSTANSSTARSGSGSASGCNPGWTGRSSADLAPLFAAEAMARSQPALRGPLHRLTESLGLIPGVDEETLSADLRPRLRALGVRSGRFALFMPALLKPRADGDAGSALGRCTTASRCPRLPAAALVSLPAAPARLAGRFRCHGRLGRSRPDPAAAGYRRESRRRTGLSRPPRADRAAVRAWRPASRSSRTCCRRCCAGLASEFCRPRAGCRTSRDRRHRRC